MAHFSLAAETDPELRDLLMVKAHQRSIQHRTTGAVLKVIAADSETAAGRNTTAVIVDDLWLFGKRAGAANMLMEAMGGLATNRDYATEVTLQPLERYPLDAAILFSDILVVPDALGQHVRFETGEGPRLTPISNAADLKALRETSDQGKMSRVYEAVERVRARLPQDVALIGFCGAPWTVATYMIAGHGTADQLQPRRVRGTAEPECQPGHLRNARSALSYRPSHQ